MNDTGSFRTVLRGYDPVRVDERVEELVAELHASQDRCADLTRHVASLQRRLSEPRALPAAAGEPGAVTFADLGARIGQMLTLAEEEAAELSARAEADAEATRKEAEADARMRRVEADRYNAAVRTDADTQAARVLADARREADDVLDAAERHAAARSEEAEAVWEEHRAAAAQSAADFELSLASRREHAETDFSARTAAAKEQLASLERAGASARVRGEALLADATAQARAVLEDAQARAGALLSEARAKADRVHGESERELTAASHRRDSINAQLSNVRQMLSTLSGGAPVIGIEDASPAALAQPRELGASSHGARTTPPARSSQPAHAARPNQPVHRTSMLARANASAQHSTGAGAPPDGRHLDVIDAELVEADAEPDSGAQAQVEATVVDLRSAVRGAGALRR